MSDHLYILRSVYAKDLAVASRATIKMTITKGELGNLSGTANKAQRWYMEIIRLAKERKERKWLTDRNHFLSSASRTLKDGQQTGQEYDGPRRRHDCEAGWK